jgi:hypothetical protein
VQKDKGTEVYFLLPRAFASCINQAVGYANDGFSVISPGMVQPARIVRMPMSSINNVFWFVVFTLI